MRLAVQILADQLLGSVSGEECVGHGGRPVAYLPVKVSRPALNPLVLPLAIPPRLMKGVVLRCATTKCLRNTQLGRDDAAQVAGIWDRVQSGEQVVLRVQDAGEAGRGRILA